MKMKRLLLTLAIALLAIPSLPARDDEVIVTRQLTMGQRNSLPEKTITVETKRLSFNKKADAALTEAVTLVMDTIARGYKDLALALVVSVRANTGLVLSSIHRDFDEALMLPPDFPDFERDFINTQDMLLRSLQKLDNANLK